MSRRKATPKAPTAAPAAAQIGVAEGRAPSLDLVSAVAIASANLAAGFDPPPAVQAVLDEADEAELQTAMAEVAQRAAEAATQPEPPAAPAQDADAEPQE
jgi:hypothetical protein